MKSLYLKQEEFERIFKHHLKVSSYSMSIRTLFGERLSRRIKYDPYYQRNYVWDKAKATFFIESILLGTDIPPLIFFNSGGQIEVIDGRQRFETIQKFKQNTLTLTLQGLHKLPQLQKESFNSIDPWIQQIFDDAKIRIFEFEVINEPRLDPSLEDKIKKEIFRRYNSGITPLSTAEIDNATYDDDDVTNILKKKLAEHGFLLTGIVDTFLGARGARSNSQLTLSLEFLRKYLILTEFPISAYAAGNNRKEILDLFYDFLVSNTENPEKLCESYIEQIRLVLKLRNLIKNTDVTTNRLVFECILWALNVITKEKPGVDIYFDHTSAEKIELHYVSNSRLYSQDNSFYYRSVIDRFRDTAYFFGEMYGVDFGIYIRDQAFKDNLRQRRQSEKEAKLKLEELDGLRANKPDPSLVPIDEIVNELNTKRYLIRPSYQRQERISVNKASAIIESIILGISLPPIFIFKSKDGIKEVVDGQQRLLSILAFLGKQYLDESGRLCYSNISNFALKNLKILREYNEDRYNELDESLKDRILDFRLQIIEIDSKVNPNFEPVDLFIRLNNKPFPIKDNSFEMWNSFVDKDVIQCIKEVTDRNIDWFFLKVRAPDKNKDRMHNEEMITMLAYMRYKGDYTNSLGVYLRDEKLNCRIKEKRSISVLLEDLSLQELRKRTFLDSVDHVASFIANLGVVLGDGDKRKALNVLLGLDEKRSVIKRSLVDFYMLYLLLGKVETECIRFVKFDNVCRDMRIIQDRLRNASGAEINSGYLDGFHSELNRMIATYANIGQ